MFLSGICVVIWSVLQMNTNRHPKTLGPKSAFLVAELYEQQKTVFSHKDVEKITGLGPKSARSLVRRLVNHGVTTRLKPGLFILVPSELGHERDYLGKIRISLPGRSLADLIITYPTPLQWISTRWSPSRSSWFTQQPPGLSGRGSCWEPSSVSCAANRGIY